MTTPRPVVTQQTWDDLLDALTARFLAMRQAAERARRAA